MNRAFQFEVGEYYHIYQRGNEKRKIFIDQSDPWRFLSLLYTANATNCIHLSDYDWKDKEKIFSLGKDGSLVALGAYCLMPNHYHLLAKETVEGGISKFMQKLVTGYSMYFNKKNQRTGALLEGPFRARHVTDDSQLQYLYAYIHLNPVKTHDPESWAGKRITDPERAQNFLEEYPFSSYQFYAGQNPTERHILSPKKFPDYFSQPADFNKMLNDWIHLDDDL